MHPNIRVLPELSGTDTGFFFFKRTCRQVKKASALGTRHNRNDRQPARILCSRSIGVRMHKSRDIGICLQNKKEHLLPFEHGFSFLTESLQGLEPITSPKQPTVAPTFVSQPSFYRPIFDALHDGLFRGDEGKGCCIARELTTTVTYTSHNPNET